MQTPNCIKTKNYQINKVGQAKGSASETFPLGFSLNIHGIMPCGGRNKTCSRCTCIFSVKFAIYVLKLNVFVCVFSVSVQNMVAYAMLVIVIFCRFIV